MKNDRAMITKRRDWAAKGKTEAGTWRVWNLRLCQRDLHYGLTKELAPRFKDSSREYHPWLVISRSAREVTWRAEFLFRQVRKQTGHRTKGWDVLREDLSQNKGEAKEQSGACDPEERLTERTSEENSKEGNLIKWS
jgi:hypothetical protein